MATGDITQTEAVAKAVVKEGITTGATAGVDAVAAEMIKRGEDANFREGLGFTSEIPISRDEVFGRIDQIGTGRDNDGNRTRSHDEQRRFSEASDAANLIFKFKELGFDKLGLAEQNAITERIENAILQNPRLAAEYRGLSTDADRTKFKQRLAADKAFSTEVARILSEFAKKGNLDGSAQDKSYEVGQKQLEHDISVSELQDVRRRISTTQATIDSFDESQPTHTKLIELNNATTELAQKQQALANALRDQRVAGATAQGTLEGRAQIITPGNRINTEGVNIAGQRMAEATAAANADQLRLEIEELKAKIARLEQQRESAQQQRKQLTEEESVKRLAEGKANIELIKAQRDYHDAVELRKRQEEQIVDSMNSVFTEATKKLIDKQVEAMGAQFEESLRQIKTEELSVDQKTLITALENRWFTAPPRRFGGRTQPRRQLNQALINTDFNTLMTTGDEGYIRFILLQTENPATPGTNYTDTQITELFKNESFMKQTRPKALEKLVAAKAMVGGIEEVDVYKITTSTWGEGLIKNALAKNNEFRNQINEMMGSGALDRPDFMEKLRREAEHNPGLLAILAAILGGAAGSVVGAPLAGGLGLAALAAGGTRAGIGYARSGRMFG